MNPFFHSILAVVDEAPRDVSEVGESLIYTWFGRPNWAYSEVGKRYWIGTTDDTPEGTTQHITQYDLVTDTYTTTRLGTVYEKDDHNQVQILIRQSDSRLIGFYTEHSGAALRYRISVNPLDSTSWENEITLNPLQNYSYLSPYQAANGDIFIFFRSMPSAGTLEWYYMKSTDGGLTFSDLTQFYVNGATQSYLISAQNGNQVHFLATNGHPENNPTLNVSTYHFYFDMTTETVHKSDGTTFNLPVSVEKMTLINQTVNNDTSWGLDISFKNNLPRVLFTIYPNGRSNNYLNKDLYFQEWNGTSWTNKTFISRTLSGYIEDDSPSLQEAAYPPASRFDTKNPNVVWMPKQVNGILEIHKVELGVNNLYIEQVTFNSEVDNWRPISVPSPINNLLWLKKNMYNMYTDYDISLQTKTVPV